MAEDIYCSLAYERVTLADMPPDGRKKNAASEGPNRNSGVTALLRTLEPGEGVWIAAPDEPDVGLFASSIMATAKVQIRGAKFTRRVDKNRKRVGIWRLE